MTLRRPFLRIDWICGSLLPIHSESKLLHMNAKENPLKFGDFNQDEP